jgi:hypothetical protein
MGGETKSAALEPMKTNLNPDDAKLSELLLQARVSPLLPPRFQENVWRRIEHTEAPAPTMGGLAWLDTLAALVLRPRFAYATVATLMLMGVLLGTHQGAQVAKQDAQARYVALVAPNSLR